MPYPWADGSHTTLVVENLDPWRKPSLACVRASAWLAAKASAAKPKYAWLKWVATTTNLQRYIVWKVVVALTHS